MVTQTYDLNMIPSGKIINVHVSQYDVGRVITFNLLNGSASFTPPTGSTATIDGTKPDKKGFSLAATLSGSTASFTTTENMCAVPGQTICEFRIKKNTQNVGTANFILDVERAGLADDVDISQTELPEYIAAARTSAENAEAWAVGTKNGQPVSQTDPQYDNYAKLYAQQAAGSATTASEDAVSASNSATAAAGSASDSEAWAVGERGGVPVSVSDETYHNNSEWYASVALQLIQGGIPDGTTVSFWIQNGHLYVQQTIDGVQQQAVDLGEVNVPDYVFNTAADMNTAIAGGQVRNGGVCYVKEHIINANGTSY